MAGLPLLVGVLHDFPSADGGAAFEWAVRKGFDEVAATGRLPGEVEFVHESVAGLPLPGGSAHSVARGFAALEQAGVLAVLGPAITDNALVVQPLADASGLATINYSGAEESRSRCSFHFQIGSLEDEPSFLAAHLVGRGLHRVALVHDSSHIGRRMAEYFGHACAAAGLSLIARAMVPLGYDDAREALVSVRAASPDAVVSLGLWGVARAVAVGMADSSWDVPAVANSALIYGHHDAEWAKGWEGWAYIDTVSDDNTRYRALAQTAEDDGRAAGPGQAGAYDMGRLLAEGFARADHLTRDGVVRGLERVKSLPSATGREGTVMGFGTWDRAALKGQFLVIRQWRDGQSVEWRGPR